MTGNLRVGITENVTASFTLSGQIISDMQGIGNGVWVRYQQKWTQIETSAGVYNWTNSDTSVANANANNINLLYQIQSPPNFRQIRDGLGNNCTLNASISNAGPITSITVTPLVAGTYIPNGMTLTVNFGGGTAENFVVNNPGAVYTAGATVITVNSRTPTNNHSIGEQVYEQGGPAFADANSFATFAQLVANRYNGLNGHGVIQALQVENENYDAGGANRIGSQVTTLNWDGTSTWDNGGAILAPVFSLCRQKVLQVYPGLPVLPCSVRRAVTVASVNIGGINYSPSMQHIKNWTEGFVSNLSLGQVPDWFDFHFYKGSDFDFDNTLIGDPTLPTWFDAAHTLMNNPDVQSQIGLMTRAFQKFSVPLPTWLCGEFGWDLYDDGGGQTFNLSLTTGAITAGVPITSLNTVALTHGFTNGEPIWLDNNNSGLVETGLFAYGNAALNATVVQVTSDSRGNGSNVSVAQKPFTPVNNHANNAQCYAGNTTDIYDQNVVANYFIKLITVLVNNGGKAFCFTDLTTAVVSATPPFPATSTAIKSVGQTIGGVYKLLPPYYALVQGALIQPSSGSTSQPQPINPGQPAGQWQFYAMQKKRKRKKSLLVYD